MEVAIDGARWQLSPATVARLNGERGTYQREADRRDADREALVAGVARRARARAIASVLFAEKAAR